MTVPRTWVAGELVPASTMNTHVRDMLNAIAISKAMLFGFGDLNGVPLTTGLKTTPFLVPIAVRATGWTIFADATGSAVLDIWKGTFASPPTSAASSICGSEKPTIIASTKGQDNTLTTWTTDFAAGDVIIVNLDSVSGGLKALTLTLPASLLALV
jgi:hypothetical protein